MERNGHNMRIGYDSSIFEISGRTLIKYKGKYSYTVTIPDMVEEIASNAIVDNAVSKIELGKNVRVIGALAFNTGVREIVIPDSVERIENGAFSACGLLTKIKLGRGLKYIGPYAFRGTRISEIELPDSLEEIGDYAFARTPLARVEFGKRLWKIGAYAFSETQLSEICLPESCQEVGSHAFSGINSVRKIDFGGLKQISKNSFHDMLLGEIIIPDTVEVIEEYAFGGKIHRVVLGKNVRYVDRMAFSAVGYGYGSYTGIQEIINYSKHMKSELPTLFSGVYDSARIINVRNRRGAVSAMNKSKLCTNCGGKYGFGLFGSKCKSCKSPKRHKR